MRVKVSATGLYTYPDVVVVCGQPQFEDRQRDTLLNPTVIIEMLSPSTETYDRGGKFDHYSTLASLTDYLLVAQDSPGDRPLCPPGGWQMAAQPLPVAGRNGPHRLHRLRPAAWPMSTTKWSGRTLSRRSRRFRRVKEEPIEYALRPGYPA